MKAKLAFWKHEAGYWAKGLWRRYWPPARSKALTAERDDWIRWCENAEEMLAYHKDLNRLAQGLIISKYEGWDDIFEAPGWNVMASRWLYDFKKTLN